MAGGRSLRDLHRKVVKIEPALVKPQCGCEPLCRQNVGHVERSGPKPYRGGWRAQQRWSEFGVRPARSRSDGWGGPSASAERLPSGMRSTVSSPSISASGGRCGDATAAPASSASSAWAISALACATASSGVVGRKFRLPLALIPAIVAARRENVHRSPRKVASKPISRRPERAAACRRKPKRGCERDNVWRLDLAAAKQPRVVGARRRQELTAPRQVRTSDRARRVDIVALFPSTGRVEPHVRAARLRPLSLSEPS